MEGMEGVGGVEKQWDQLEVEAALHLASHEVYVLTDTVTPPIYEHGAYP